MTTSGWPLKSLSETFLPSRLMRVNAGAGLPRRGDSAAGESDAAAEVSGTSVTWLSSAALWRARMLWTPDQTTSEIPAAMMNSKSALRITSRTSFRRAAFACPCPSSLSRSGRLLLLLEVPPGFGQDVALAEAGEEL